MHALPPREACELVIGRHCDRGNRGGGRRIGDECREVKLQPGKLQAGKLQTKRISIAARAAYSTQSCSLVGACRRVTQR